MTVFAGHFPSHPVLPGALLLDWVVNEIERQLASRVETVSQVKFPQAAAPGSRLELSLQATENRVRFDVSAISDHSSHIVASGVAGLERPLAGPGAAGGAVA